MYLFLVLLGWVATYFLFYFLFPAFFNIAPPALNRKSLYSVVLTVVLSFLIFAGSSGIRDLELSNRVLHIFGGGFLSFLVCFLVVKDTGLNIGKFQFFVFSFLIMLSLGAVNEMLEYALQNYFNFSFAKTANDTWLDIISNTVGGLIGGIFLTPFINRKRS